MVTRSAGARPWLVIELGLGLAIGLAIGSIAPACSDRDDLDGRRRPIPGLTERGDEYALVSQNTPVAIDLLDNRAAAVVHGTGGLTVECGTADFAKYVEGAYRSGWHLSAEDNGQRAALFDGLAGSLYFPVDRDADGVTRAKDGSIRVHITARAAKPQQLVSVLLNEKRLGDISMPTTEWKTYSIRAPASTLREGENKLRFYFRHTGEIDGKRSAAALQRVRVGAVKPVDQPVVHAETVTFGQQRLMALSTSQAARLSYYLRIPTSGPVLVFAPGGKGVDMAVRIARPGGTSETIWNGTASESWQTQRVDLADWAGDIVRLDLSSEGPVHWGRPQIVVANRAGSSESKNNRRVADHVIIWVVSALRHDRASGAVAAPNFQRARERGIEFSSAHAAAPAPAASHVALLTGKHPQGNAVLENFETLGERFNDAGFATALISGNGFVNDETGFAQGFAIYKNPMRRRHPFRARVLWQQAKRVLHKQRDGRSFIYMVTVEPHLPYNPTAESLAAEWDRGPMRFSPVETIALREAVVAGKETLSREEEAYIRALYDAEVRDADEAFGEMLSDLEELGIADRTAIILLGDHGEELFERGQFGHGLHLYQEVLHVPLVVILPKQTSSSAVETDVSLIDIHATALEMAGITAGTSNQGSSVLGARDETLPRPIFAHLPGYGRTLKLGRYKLHVPLRGQHALYDLERDPEERHDLMGQRPLVERYMRNVFGVGVAYQSVWSRARWGTSNNMSPAFAADHGL